MIMPAESFGQVDAVEDGEESEPVYSEPYHVYASCEHIYETVEEALFARMETQPPPETPSLSEDALQLRKMRSAPIPRRVSRRRSFVLERESASLLPLEKGVIVMGRFTQGREADVPLLLHGTCYVPYA